MKKAISLRITESTLQEVDSIAMNSGYSRTDIFELSFEFLKLASKNKGLRVEELQMKSWTYHNLIHTCDYTIKG